MEALIRNKFRREQFKTHSECVICTLEFKEDDEVTPLPCDTAHYFHSECIKPWIQKMNACPLCKQAIPVSEDRLPENSEDEEG